MAEGGGEQQQQANQAPGYSYEFIDKVPEDYYCYECKLVAKDLTFTSCCGETFCLECIEKYRQDGKPCPNCKKVEDVVPLKQVKYQSRIRRLSVACELKDRGCEWKGALQELEAHLDPALDNCQYVDIQCPLNCLQKIPKNKMEEHLKNSCVKRDFFCQYCNYKASYEEVKNVHLLVCRFVPVQCPNRCGVTCEREDLEDHLETCRLQEIECEFANIGCDKKFCREDTTQHMDDNSLRHLMLVALHSRNSKEEFEEKMKDFSGKMDTFTGKMDEVTGEKDELKGRMEAEQKKNEELERRMGAQQKEHEDLKGRMEAQQKEREELRGRMEVQQKEYEELKGRMEAQQKEYEELKGRMEAQQKKHEEDNETVTKKLEAEEKKVKDLKGDVSELKINLSNQNNETERVQKQQREELQSLKEELNKQLKETICKLEKILNDKQKDFDKVLNQKDQISKQKSSLENQKKEFDRKIDASDQRCKQLETDIKNGERKFAMLLKRLDELDGRCKQLEADKEESTKNARILEKNIKDLTTERDKLSEEVRKLSDKTEENKKQTAAHQEGIKKLQAKKPDNSLEEMKRLKELMDRHVQRFERLEEKLPKVNAISDYLGNFERTFEMKNFTVEKDKNKARDWKSPAMYTHMCGYKFCIGLDANGRGGSQGEAIYAELYVMPGEYDSLLRWPAKASFTLELIHQRGGKNVKYNTAMKKWDKPELNFKCLSVFPYTEVNNSYCFLEHNKLGDFLVDDTLKFCTSVVLH